MNYLVNYCKNSFYILIFISFTLFILSLKFLLMDLVYFIEWEIVSLHSMSIVMTFLFDWMSLMFMSFVLLISSLVIFYSDQYMGEDYNVNRFILLVLMFVMSMMMLIISPNLISILLGWDGLGLVSYCLVIYFQNVKSYNAGMLTALSNRIGDVALLLAIAWMLNYGSWNYIFYLDMMKNNFEMMVIGGLVMLAAMTKSAQIPFSSWLPAAMAAPTPVSALVHSSTLVTAGVYLLIRFNILLDNSKLGQFLLLVSGLTMFMAGLGANFEFDLKKIIALSTLSQLGLMMSILSIGYYKLAFFHLLTHALFKALLFMCAGVIIHNTKNAQDIRFMGGLSMSMPLTCSCFNIANLALCGMPFLAGFYSKDLILETVMLSYMNFFSFFLFFFSTGLTVCYSFRLVYYSMTGDFNSTTLNMLNDKGWTMSFSIFFLMVMAIIGGSMLSWLMFFNPEMICLPYYLKNLTLMVCLLGGFTGYLISNVNFFFINKSLVYYNFSFFSGSMWFMPLISTVGVVKWPLILGMYSYKMFDQGWSEYFGGQMLYNQLKIYSLYVQEFQNNNLKIYLLSYMLWVIILVSMMLFLN
ncbi:NADH dehydrogenase subunit 5 (mitochondrion) [Aedes aegypti]|uniref:NADH-ubiquinone oxidoreductase chain 5 n=15 Tax=Stegomyia TaxID=53541 RepID=NU5M_AEDAE|nr:NADH dehydrogenase subunit 5 [Aedes aegypti]B0FWD3.1 RecName: Full=NADH-ubiquinone oxidoreductase chain 5; AltName: Full=NADH dehydrogenase subunit 5 [Aedes aegypti]ABY51630.1 NADH dehydrogenase subunit 5 [Aedes aegypti]ARW59271.1 NADH dehydrogenase subunit 5 [Aedes aegypti]QEE94223.1 NADH dehydrogenase subunit 5 [Aedes aegypti]UMB51325.1 NADH dehydrogenase subunit 5 [Aedes aegypti]UMB51338.1 NADH dehydrogenase subunit 5 [Aedes aegypti]